jgi:hypothetical protein
MLDNPKLSLVLSRCRRASAAGDGTPRGTFHPQAVMPSYFSRKSHTIVYFGFAIHGTNDILRFGRPASHDSICPTRLFALVQPSEPRNTTCEASTAWILTAR